MAAQHFYTAIRDAGGMWHDVMVTLDVDALVQAERPKLLDAKGAKLTRANGALIIRRKPSGIPSARWPK